MVVFVRLAGYKRLNSSITTSHHDDYEQIVQKTIKTQSCGLTPHTAPCSGCFSSYWLPSDGGGGGTGPQSVWSWTSHRSSWSSFWQSSDSRSWTPRPGSSLGKPRRLGLDDEDEFPVLPSPTRGFFGFRTSPSSRNSRNLLTRFWLNRDSEPLRRLRGTSKMVSRRLENKQEKVEASAVTHH